MKIYRLHALLLALSLAGFPLIAAISTVSDIASTPLSIAMRTLVLALSVILIALALIRAQTAFPRGWYWVPLLWFWGAYLARLLDDTIFRSATLSRPPQDYWIWAVGASLIPALALLTKTKPDAYRLAYRLLFPMLSIAAALAAFLGGTAVMSPISGLARDTGRLQLESLNPISLGHLGVSLLLLSLWRLILGGEKVAPRARMLAVAGSALGIYLTVAAASRGPIVSLISVLVFYALVRDPKRTWKPALLLVAIVSIGYFLALRFEETGEFRAATRIVSAFGGEDMAVRGREQALSGALEQFVRNPLIGDALEETTTGFYPHNVIVESFMATGIIGGLPFLALLYFAVRGAFRLIKQRSEYAWLALLFTQHLVAAQFSGSIYGATTMWALLGATLALSYGARKTSVAMKGDADYDEGAAKWA